MKSLKLASFVDTVKRLEKLKGISSDDVIAIQTAVDHAHSIDEQFQALLMFANEIVANRLAIDGTDIEPIAVKHGLLSTLQTVNSQMVGKCGDRCDCARMAAQLRTPLNSIECRLKTKLLLVLGTTDLNSYLPKSK